MLLANDKLELTVLVEGTAMAKLVLKDDPTLTSPLWDPATSDGFGGVTGHFPCVDGFGGVSPEERAAGFPAHGEAHLQNFEVRSRDERSLTLAARLPLAQENITRVLRLLPGEQVDIGRDAPGKPVELSIARCSGRSMPPSARPFSSRAPL